MRNAFKKIESWETMSLLNETFTLKNQMEIAKIGLGTWQSSPEDTYHATKFAL